MQPSLVSIRTRMNYEPLIAMITHLDNTDLKACDAYLTEKNNVDENNLLSG